MRGLAAALVMASSLLGGEGRITIDYPPDRAIFPPEFPAPTFLWRDESAATTWVIEAPGVRVVSRGEPMPVGEIDPRCVAPANRPPEAPPGHSWKPDADTWAAMKGPAVTVTITGYRGEQLTSRGPVTIQTSKDPIGAPIFYRDVPLMPSELEKGVIKPLAPKLLPYIAWRLRDVSQPASRVVLEGMHTCANCHSFSRDGKTLGMDLDGPHNDKGLYAIVPVGQQMSIENENVISWKSFRGQMEKDKRIGFMSQVSPAGEYVMTATQVEYYVANYTDYRLLQTFYPTRGVLAWYSRADGRIRTLPGADDPRYVQANAVWSPDGKYLLFVRAEARDSYPEGRKMAEYSNDPNEVQIQYDLYRIPFNEGRGGKATPVEGASRNGMSNSFPKVSPDGKWIVFVKSRNGQLMRPDGQLYIVPAAGGEARRMRCNTPLMNSWHSFSPNGRWMVFSSKSRSPYTQLFLTHIDEEGNDSPAILIENSTAANRAANIPEFVNMAPEQQMAIAAPAAEFYRLYDRAFELTEAGQIDAALKAWTKALELDPEDAKARNNFAALLLRLGKLDEAEAQLKSVLAVNPEFTSVRDNYGLVLFQRGKIDDAIAEWRKSLEINPRSTEAHGNLGNAYILKHKYKEAAAEWRAALELEPGRLPVLGNIAWLLATCPDKAVRDGKAAVSYAELALKLSGGSDPVVLDTLGAAYAEAGRFAEAIESAKKAAALAARSNDAALVASLQSRIAEYENGRGIRSP